MNLDDLSLPIGKALKVSIKGQDYKTHTFDAQLIGYQTNQMVMLSMPIKPGQVLLHIGLRVSVEISLPEGRASFEADIDDVGDWGFRYLKLDYPGSIHYEQPRENIRVPADAPVELIAHTSLGMSTGSIHGQVLDVSTAGIRVVCEKELTSMVTEVEVGLYLSAYDLQRDMTVFTTIANKSAPSADYPDYPYGYGLALDRLDEADYWFLHAYCLEHIIRQRVILYSK